MAWSALKGKDFICRIQQQPFYSKELFYPDFFSATRERYFSVKNFFIQKATPCNGGIMVRGPSE
jgi:hypothetical protein